MKKIFVTTLAGILLTLSFGTAEADHSWGGYHWARTANPFTLEVGDNVSGAWDAYLTEASADWTTSSVLDLTVVPGQTNPKNCKPVPGKIQVCNSKYGKNGWLGIAQIWITGGEHISQATTKLNDTYFNTAKYNTPSWRELVICQEIAHDFGLDHQDETFDNPNLGSCMDYTSNPDGPPSNVDPNAHDFEQLEAIYAHLDGSTTIASPQSASNTSDADDSDDLGKEIKKSKDGHSSIFIKKNGKDFVVSHVIWA